MFLTDKISITFDGLDFEVIVPGDDVLTALFTQSNVMIKEEITPATFAKMADIIAPFVDKKPETFDSFPTITKNRLLFEIAKFILNESLSIPELKKK